MAEDEYEQQILVVDSPVKLLKVWPNCSISDNCFLISFEYKLLFMHTQPNPVALNLLKHRKRVGKIVWWLCSLQDKPGSSKVIVYCVYASCCVCSKVDCTCCVRVCDICCCVVV